MVKTVLIFSFVLIYFFPISAKENNYATVFKTAKEYYSKGKYDSTINIIRTYLKKHGREKPTEFIVPLLMEALVRVNDFVYFNKLLNIYQRKFPKSDFLPRLLYIDGIVKAREKNYKMAIISFSHALTLGVNPILDSLSRINTEKICQNNISLKELSDVAKNTELHPAIAEIVEYYEIMNLHGTGHITKSKNLGELFRKKFPKSDYNNDIKKIISKSKNIQKSTLSIGLLAPISGEYSDIGKNVVRGVQLAIDEYNRTFSPKIELVILDTRGNMVETAQKTRELIEIHQTPIIVGPVLSSNATVAASALMNTKDIIMITPTATDDGIARLGSNIFQMNVTLSILGKKIARYAIENLNIKEFAIIAPITEYGRILSESFKNEVIKFNGKIYAEEFFDEGTNDFRMQFESLRLKLSERKWEQMALEGNPVYGDRAIDKRKKDSYLSDSTIGIGGLFIPAEAEDVIKLSSQVYFHRLQTQLLGSNGWHSKTTLSEGKKYVNNAIFSTNFETTTQNEKWETFSKSFLNQFKEKPDRIAAPLSYDATNLILNALNEENSMEAIRDKLYSIKNFNGASGMISFDPIEGVNSEAKIMKISNKKFIRVQ